MKNFTAGDKVTRLYGDPGQRVFGRVVWVYYTYIEVMWDHIHSNCIHFEEEYHLIQIINS